MPEVSRPSAHAAVVLTSIAAPNAVMRAIAADCRERALDFYVVGDTKSPDAFDLDGCQFYSYEAQLALPFETARLCPTRHYARKNIGYLLAIKSGVELIIETDDDNLPSPSFYEPLPLEATLPSISDAGWVNVYRYFTGALIWPRGLPLDEINAPLPPLAEPGSVRIPIQQGLANENPDVDAIYRLTLPLPFNFEKSLQVALSSGTWCPYNSQNTIHYREAFPLLYLPAHCSFRMTDIWRSFVAQRIAGANHWSILFREATVVQDRNDHSLMRDFEDEISGYLGNRKIAESLDALDIVAGVDLATLAQNLRLCYRTLVAGGHVGEAELPLLDAWIADLGAVLG
jgi:hypothetical protein